MSNEAFAAEFLQKVDEDYCAATPKSAELMKEAEKWVPGGDYRVTTFWKPHPYVVKRGDGCYLFDEDGNKYLDFAGNWTSMPLGVNPPEVVEAVKNAADNVGLAMAAANTAAHEWAKLICERMKSVERVRFNCSGSEATLFALRAARRYSGKEKFIKIRGGFHGSCDELQVVVGWIEDTPGIPRSAAENVICMTANDIEATREVILEHKDEAACVIFEPILGFGGLLPLDKEYVQFLREITREHGILLIADEIVSFRLAPGGAQEIYGIECDLTCLGKAISNGVACGAVAGKAEVMDVFSPWQKEPLFHGGTYIATPLAQAAGVATLTAFNKEKIDYINKLGEDLAQDVRDILKEVGIKALVTGMGSLHQIHFRSTEFTCPEQMDWNSDLQMVFFKLMLKRGITVSARNIFIISTPMGQAEMDATVKAVRETREEMKPYLEATRPDLIP